MVIIKENYKFDTPVFFFIEVNTVHSFQGAEYSCIPKTVYIYTVYTE